MEAVIREEAGTIESWVRQAKADFEDRSQACFGAIGKKMGDKMQQLQSLQREFEGRIRALLADIQALQNKMNPVQEVSE